MSAYAAWSPRHQGLGQAAEPSADFDADAADDVLFDPDPLEVLFDSLEELLDDSLEELLDEADAPDGAGTEADELLRESVR